uniref:Uncharacterized protein n=1 Tax=Panagrolaimus sp. JU765 TaxID=591449 RepID=A0AC34QFF3_9BILA
MASSERDRAKAVGFATFAPAFGYLVGALLQAGFTKLVYPGPKLLFGIHLNLYTAPAMLMLILYVISLALLFTIFDGKMRIPPAEIQLDDESQIVETIPDEGKAPYDKVAVIFMLFTTVSLNFAALNPSVTVLIYMMAAYEWTSSQSVLYVSIVLGCSGIAYVLFVAGYAFLKFGQKISARIALITSIFAFFAFHLITFPWPFIKTHMNYKHPQGQPATTKFNQTLNFPGFSNDTLVGCNVDYKWCETTPVTPMLLFYVPLIICISVAVPLMNVNLDLLYSRILGPIKQGTMTGIYNASGQLLNIVGPFFFTFLYTKSGPRWIWLCEIIVGGITLALWAVFYKRMIPYSESQAKILAKEKKVPKSSTDSTAPLELSIVTGSSTEF